MTAGDIVSIASEHADRWLNIWELFVIVTGAVVTVVGTFRTSLSDHAPALIVAFLIFSVAHGVTISFHYGTAHDIQILLDDLKDKDEHEVALAKSMLPPLHQVVILPFYGFFTLLVAGWIGGTSTLQLLRAKKRDN